MTPVGGPYNFGRHFSPFDILADRGRFPGARSSCPKLPPLPYACRLINDILAVPPQTEGEPP